MGGASRPGPDMADTVQVWVAAIRVWPKALRLALLGGLIPLAIMVAGWVPPIPQDPAYHAFADQRTWLGVPHFANVVSNLPFLLVTAAGLVGLGRRWSGFPAGEARLPELAFYLAVALTAFGSAWYHLDPTTPTLFWDRVGIAMIAAALCAIFLADRIDQRFGVRIALPVLLVMALASVEHWRLSELAGRGDLRCYALMQFLPGLLVPLICLSFAGRRTRGRFVAYFLLWYGLAKLFEGLDQPIFALLDHTVSGHTLKHLAAATACAMVPWMLHQSPDLTGHAPPVQASATAGTATSRRD